MKASLRNLLRGPLPALLVSAAAAFLIVTLVGGTGVVHSAAGEALLQDVEAVLGGKALPLGKGDVSPLAAWTAGKLSKAATWAPVTAVARVDGVATVLLSLVITGFLLLLVPGPLAALGGPVFLLLPAVAQGAWTTTPDSLMLLSLLGPALLFGIAEARSPGWVRVSLFALAGALAGFLVFGHPLALWTGLAAGLVWLVSQARSVRRGRLEMAPCGLELVVAVGSLGFFMLVARGLLGAEKKELLDYLFGAFYSPVPDQAVAGQAYPGEAGALPPWWTATRFLLARLPLPLLLGSLAGGVWFARRGTRRIVLWAPLGAFLAVWLVATLAGTPNCGLGPDLTSALMLVPVLVLLPGAWALWRRLSGHRLASAALALAALLIVAHLGLVAARQMPYPGRYASLLAGGTARFNQANDVQVDVVLDQDAALELLAGGPQVVVLPWGKDAAGVLGRFGHWTGAKAPKVRNGGAWPTLVVQHNASPLSRLGMDACKGGLERASLRVDRAPVWCLIDGQGEP